MSRGARECAERPPLVSFAGRETGREGNAAKGMRVSIVLPYPASHAVGGFLVHYELANHLAHGGDVPTIAHARSFRRPKWRLLLNYGASFVTMRPKTMAPWFQFDGRVRLRIVPWLKSVFLPKADVTLLTAYETAEAMGPYTAHGAARADSVRLRVLGRRRPF